MIATPTLTYRPIDPATDGALAAANYRDACLLSFGDLRRFQGIARYLRWLRSRVEEFPDGHLLALREGRCVGQLELQVPYGLRTGYVNLYYVTPPFRRQGFGRLMHLQAEHYFRSWEATRVELHVSPSNEHAVGFYRATGYRLVKVEKDMWRMAKSL